MLHHLHAMESSDSSLVQHLLTWWQPAWQPSHSNPHTCKQALVELESGIYCAADSQHETRQTFCRLSYAFLHLIPISKYFCRICTVSNPAVLKKDFGYCGGENANRIFVNITEKFIYKFWKRRVLSPMCKFYVVSSFSQNLEHLKHPAETNLDCDKLERIGEQFVTCINIFENILA